jgi:hypothetical protein
LGIGVIVRDYEEKVLTTLQAPRLYVIDLVTAEATMALRAAVFARELQQLELEGDSVQDVQVLKNEGKKWCRYDLLIEYADLC